VTRKAAIVLSLVVISIAALAAELPRIGTVLVPFPGGPAKVVADQACLNCHASDVVRQQKLTEKQWTANVTKMIGWGAEVPESRKDELVRYLAANFGPDNSAFQPVVVQPIRATR
jgi:hypothetical protein